MTYKSTFYSVFILIVSLFSVAHADVKYTVVAKDTSATSSDESKKLDQVTDTNTYFVTPNKTRREDVKGYAIAPSKEVFITRCDLKQEFRIDDALKIYTVSDLVPNDLKSPATESELKEKIPEQKWTTHYSIQKQGTQKVDGFDTTSYLWTEIETTSGYMGSWKSTSIMKMWVTALPGWQQNCDTANVKLLASYTQIKNDSDGRHRTIQEYTGDIDEVNKIREQVPVRIEATFDNLANQHGTGTLDQNLTSYSPNEKFDNSLFEVPSGYRKVSAEEYQKLQSHAMWNVIQKSKHSK